jgi:hypothetical protein
MLYLLKVNITLSEYLVNTENDNKNIATNSLICDKFTSYLLLITLIVLFERFLSNSIFLIVCLLYFHQSAACARLQLPLQFEVGYRIENFLTVFLERTDYFIYCSWRFFNNFDDFFFKPCFLSGLVKRCISLRLIYCD